MLPLFEARRRPEDVVATRTAAVVPVDSDVALTPRRLLSAHRVEITQSGRIKMVHMASSMRDWSPSAPDTVKEVEAVEEQDLVAVATRRGAEVDDMLTGTCEDVTAVEFDSIEVVVEEGAACVEVPLRRIGSLAGRVEGTWEIHNGNVSEDTFSTLSHREGTAVFMPGQATCTLELPVVEDPTWNVESLYFVVLKEVRIVHTPEEKGAPEELRAFVGDNDKMAVYSLNRNLYPGGVPPDASLPRLVWGFWRECYTDIPRKTMYGCALSLFPAIEYYLSAVVLEMLIDCGIQPDKQCVASGVDVNVPNDGDGVLFLLAGLYIIINLLQHLNSRLFRRLRLGGSATRRLRVYMFCTMVQLSQEAKEEFDEGDVSKALDTDVEKAVRTVWLHAFALLDSIIQLMVKWAITVVVTGTIGPKVPRLTIALAPPAMVLLLCLSLCTSSAGAAKHLRALNADDDWSAFVSMSEQCCALILYYHQDFAATNTLDRLHQAFNKAQASADDFTSETKLWLEGGLTFIFAVVVVIGGMSARDGSLGVGRFVVLMNAVRGFGTSLLRMSSLAHDIVVGSSAVTKIAHILNKDTQRHVRARHEKRQATDSPTERQITPSGLIQVSKSSDCSIQLRNITFKYNEAKWAFKPTNLTIPAGRLVCLPQLPGTQLHGKVGSQTLFKLIIGELLSPIGQISFPRRWRVIYVPVVPILFDGTLMYNLTFGAPQVNYDVIWQACRDLGMTTELLGKDDFDVSSNGGALRFSDRLVVSLVRALVHDVDLLLISSALDVLGEARAAVVLEYLRTYVHGRGLVPKVHLPAPLRHLKTVIYTSKYHLLTEQAEYVIEEGGRPTHDDCVVGPPSPDGSTPEPGQHLS